MGVSVQTRFDTTLNGAISDVDTELVLDDAPAFTKGYGTIERGEANEEDIYWDNVSGLQLTGLLRGLSKTALTNTEVAGNKKAHLDGVQFEGTLLHYIVNDKASKSSDEAITGAWSFNTQLPTSTDTPGANSELTTKVYVDTADNLKANLAGGNTFSGNQVFADNTAQTTTDAAPTSDKILANKKYVDDKFAGSTDTKVKASATDTTPSTLDNKATVGTHLSITVVNPGGNEQRRTDTDAIQSSSGTSDANKLIASNAGGGLDSTFLGYNKTTVEAINGATIPQAVSVMGNNHKTSLIVTSAGSDVLGYDTGTNRNFGNADATTWIAQSFTAPTDALASTIKLNSSAMLLAKNGAPAGNVYVEIQTDSGGSPSGSVVANGTSGTKVATDLVLNNPSVQTFTWATPPTLTSGGTYWRVLKRSVANDAGNYIIVRDANGDVYAGGVCKTYTASTLTWGTGSYGNIDLQSLDIFTLDYDGKVCKSDADSLIQRGKFIGFTKSNVAGGGSAGVICSNYIDGFPASSFVEGADYYVDTNSGLIVTSNTPTLTTTLQNGSALIKVGSAISDTALKIAPKFYRAYTCTALGSLGSSTGLTLDFFLECGFTPQITDIRYTLANRAGAAANDYAVHKVYVGTTVLPIQEILATGFAPVSAGSELHPGAAAVTDSSLAVVGVYENGVMLRFSEAHVDEILANVQVICESN